MNAFDKIATKSTGSASKKATKITASVDDEIRNAVDRVISIKAQVKDLEAEQGTKEGTIIAHVRPQQDEQARSGNYSKSFDVEGNDGSLVYTTSDKFSVPQDDDTQDEIKKLVGKKYDSMFEVQRTVALRSDVLKDDKLVNKIVSTLSKAGIDNIFEVTDKIKTKKGLDERVYELMDQDKLDILRTLIKQNKAGLKY